MQIQSKYDIIIVGAGVYGLCTAYYLSKLQLKIALLEQYTIGHNNGSSHSPTRITRSTYQKQIYRDLNLKCLQENWPQMEKVLNQKLVYDTPFVYYDDNPQSYAFYKKVAQEFPNFKFMSPEEVAKTYKHMPVINSKQTPIVDTKAGIIAADTFQEKLGQYLKTCPNVTVSEHTTVKKIRENDKQVGVQTQNQFLRADKLIMASGRWTSEMVPEVDGLIKVVKQFMGYLQLDHKQRYQVGKFPCFTYKQKDTWFWSLPDRKNLGVKLGNHNLNKVTPEEDTMQYQYQFVRQKALQIFGEQFIKVNNVQICHYTVTKTQDFILDYTSPTQRIFVCSCCSGHGFKFAPIIGQIISQQITTGRTKQMFEKWNHLFKIAYHKGVNLE